MKDRTHAFCVVMLQLDLGGSQLPRSCSRLNWPWISDESSFLGHERLKSKMTQLRAHGIWPMKAGLVVNLAYWCPFGQISRRLSLDMSQTPDEIRSNNPGVGSTAVPAASAKPSQRGNIGTSTKKHITR
jgi:hypothetical protein